MTQSKNIASGQGNDLSRELDAFIRGYIDLWNARDAAAIWLRVYRLDDGQPFRSEGDVEAYLAKLDGDGFGRSELHAVEARPVTQTEALVDVRFTRLKTDGTLLLKESAARYRLRKFADGWRIVQLTAPTDVSWPAPA